MSYDVWTIKELVPKQLSFPRILKSQNSELIKFGAPSILKSQNSNIKGLQNPRARKSQMSKFQIHWVPNS